MEYSGLTRSFSMVSKSCYITLMYTILGGLRYIRGTLLGPLFKRKSYHFGGSILTGSNGFRIFVNPLNPKP